MADEVFKVRTYNALVRKLGRAYSTWFAWRRYIFVRIFGAIAFNGGDLVQDDLSPEERRT